MELTAKNVTEILMDCLFKEGEDTSVHVKGEGVRLAIGFNPERLEKNKEKISELVEQLPKEFKKESGGGYSFLNACVTSNGNQWGQHDNIDELLCLGLASGKISYLLPRELWTSLPGGMPYFIIN